MMKKLAIFSIIAMTIFTILYLWPHPGTTYYIGSDPSDDYASWTSFHAAITPSPGDTVSFRKGETFREQITVPASGTSGNPITYAAHGSGADPIINGADLVTGWTQYPSWQTAWDPTVGSERTDTFRRNYRNIVLANESSYDGSKIRITAKAGATGAWTFGGASIGLMTTADDFDDAPTRITWETGNNGATIGAGSTLVSDEITFSFDKTKRYGIHFYMDSRNHISYAAVGDCYYLDDVDNTLTQSVTYSTDSNIYGLDKLEVFSEVANVWQATCTTEPNVVWFDGVKGTEQASAIACTSVGDWYWDSNILYVYSTSDPDAAYTDPGIYKDAMCLKILNVDYITVSGIKLLSSGGGCLQLGRTHDILIDNIESDGSELIAGENVTIYGISDDESYDITIQNSEIHHTNAANRKCIYIEQYTHDITISNCIIHDSYQTNIELDRRSVPEDAAHDITVTGCTIYNAGLSGFECGYDVYNNIIEKSLLYNNNKNIVFSLESHDNVARYNLVLDATNENILVSSDATDVEVYNNIIQGGNTGIYVEALSGISIVTAKNNIFYNPGTWGGAIYVEAGEVITSDYNCFYRAANLKWYWQGVEKTSFADWKTASSQDANSINSDPLMTDPANGDFTLQIGSPCIDAGTDVGLTTDYAGIQWPFPKGSAPDIGAYEYYQPVIMGFLPNPLIPLFLALFAITAYRKRLG